MSPSPMSFSALRLLLVRSALASAALVFCLAASASARPQQIAPPPMPPAPEFRDAASREGPFDVADQQYSVLFQYKVLQRSAATVAAGAGSSSTLSRFDVLGTQGNSIYHQTFPYTASQGRLQQHLSASASLLHGEGGILLVIRFLDQPDRGLADSSRVTKESWHLFSIVNGQLAPLGPLLPLGDGDNIAVGGVVAAVMMKGGIAVMPLASTAEVLALKVWTGNFYVSVPLRFDWANGQWGEGQQCYRTADGTLTERGCIMPVEAIPVRRSPDADFPYVQLFVAPDGNTDGAQNILVTPNKHIEYLETQAIVRWQAEGAPGQAQRVACTFSEVWLRVRLDGNDGWVHGQDAFAALGLPLTDPQ